MDPDDAELAQVTDDELRAAASAVGTGQVGYRGQSRSHLNEKDLDEVERFTTVAAFLVVVAGLPVLRAWSAANEWITEHGAELPAGLGPMLDQHRGAVEACRAHNPEVPRSNRGGATETARADAAPERSEVLPGPAPSLRAASIPVVHRDVKPQKDEEHAAKPCPALSPRANLRCGKPGVWGGFCVIHGQRRERGIEVRVATAATRVHQEDAMGVRTEDTEARREKLLALLKERGPVTRAEAVEVLGCEDALAGHAMRSLVDEGTTEIVGRARGARWQMKGEKRESAGGPRREPAARAAPRDAKGGGVKNGNGKANGHAKPAKKRATSPGAWEIVIPSVPEDLVESPLLEQLLETRAGLIDHVQKTIDKIDKLDALLGTFAENA